MWSVIEWMAERNPWCGTCQTWLPVGGSEETLSYAGDLMFKIGPFNVLKHPFSQEAVAVASHFVTSRMHWSHVWKQILLHLFLMVGWAEEAAHHFSGSVSIQRETDLKDLLCPTFITGNVVKASVKELEEL